MNISLRFSIVRWQLSFAAITCCLFLLGNAGADIVPSLTGAFSIDRAWTRHGGGGGTVLFAYPDNLNFGGTVMNYWEDPPCGLFVPCDQYYGGTIAGGGITFDTVLELSPTEYESINFSGTIRGGSFGGDNHLGYDSFDSYTSEWISFRFTGLWSNGWTSNGDLYIDWVDGVDIVLSQYGSMNLVTSTAAPEPATLALTSAGIVSVLGFLRRKRKLN